MRLYIFSPMLAACLLSATPAAAQSTAAATPEKAALAQDIVSIAWPPERREAMMDDLMANMLKQFRAGVPLDSFTDAGLRKIFDDYFDSIPALLRPTVQAFLPKQMQAVANAYERMFTVEELRDVKAFAKSASGRAYLQRSMEVMSDPEVAAANSAYFKDVSALSVTASGDLKAKVTEYLKQHPEAMPPPKN